MSKTQLEWDNTPIKLRSATGDVMTTTVKSASLSMTVKDLLETVMRQEDFNDNIEVPLANVSTATLKKILEWTDKWRFTTQPSADDIKDKLAESIDPWNEEYLKMELHELYDLITAANYLNIPGLLWLTTREVAYMMKGKSPEEIRQLFKIENDWTPAELEQVQKENQWCEEK